MRVPVSKDDLDSWEAMLTAPNEHVSACRSSGIHTRRCEACKTEGWIDVYARDVILRLIAEIRHRAANYALLEKTIPDKVVTEIVGPLLLELAELKADVEKVREMVSIEPSNIGSVGGSPATYDMKLMADTVYGMKFTDLSFDESTVGPSIRVTVTHKPTGCQITCAEHASRHKNQETALRLLRYEVAKHKGEA